LRTAAASTHDRYTGALPDWAPKEPDLSYYYDNPGFLYVPAHE
jgi:hypothetical protein